MVVCELHIDTDFSVNKKPGMTDHRPCCCDRRCANIHRSRFFAEFRVFVYLSHIIYYSTILLFFQ